MNDILVKNDANASSWLKEMYKIKNITSHSSIKIHPISNYECCKKPSKITSNDGNKTQKCMNCGWSLRYGI